MAFKNNLLPGHITHHRISRVTRRTSKRLKYVERLKYKQEAEWLQCNIDEPKPGHVMIYQMMDDRPAKVLGVWHDKERVKPTPPASSFNLAGGSTRLHSATKAPRDAPVQVPLTDPVEKAVLMTLLDFAHWPAKRVEAGHRWQREIAESEFVGTQTFEFVDLVRVNGDMTARVTLYVEGAFAGALARDWVFGKGQAIIYWSRPDRALVKMEAQADYQRRREARPDKFKLKLNVGLVRSTLLSDAEQDLIKDQMTVFAAALKQRRLGHDREAQRLCEQFCQQWPDCMWLPAVEELESQTRRRQQAAKRYSTAELKDLLVKSVIAYEAARTNREYDLMETTRRALAGLAVEYRRNLRKLAQGEDEGDRSRAVFALAFGEDAEYLSFVERAARDRSPQVRAMALAGLAARRSADTSVELLLSLLDDEHTAVRRRACEAVGACVSPEHYSVVNIVEKVGHIMIYDESESTRLEAVRALAAIGAPADIPKLEKALTHELDAGIREAIQSAIEQLRGKVGG
jgi:hypothetical protein